jgi:hypothetical protein
MPFSAALLLDPMLTYNFAPSALATTFLVQ